MAAGAMFIAVALLAAVTVTAVVAIAAGRNTPGGGDATTRFMRAHLVPATHETVAFVADYLARRSSLRWTCALLAVVGVNVVGLVVRDEPELSIDLFPIMGAYAVGTLVAELRLARTRGTTSRASLTARTVDSYLGPPWMAVQRATTIAAVLAMSAAVLVDPGETSSRMESGAYLVAAVLVGLGAEWAQRRIVSQPQPANVPEMIAADDAVRSGSVHAIAGVAIAFLVMAAAAASANLASDVGPALIGVVLGLLLWYLCVRPTGPSRRTVVIGFSAFLLVVAVGVGSIVALRGSTVSETRSVPPVEVTDGGEGGSTTTMLAEPAGSVTTFDPTTTTLR